MPIRRSRQKSSVVIRRRQQREIGIFVDGVCLDRVSKRLSKKISLTGLVKKLSSGGDCVFARYYTIIPNEDDSRHRAFLDAVRASGLDVCVKRLPPVGVEKQVSIDVEMASDIMAFGLGAEDILLADSQASEITLANSEKSLFSESNATPSSETRRILFVVCPNREICYPFSLLKKEAITTVVADFGVRRRDDLLGLANEYVDLSDEESLWVPEHR